MVGAAGTNQTPNVSTSKLTFNASTGTLTATGGIQNTPIGNGTASSGTFTTLTADTVASTNNGNGTNFKVGDDTWIGDINIANTLRITGQQDGTQAYIVFGNSNAVSLGRSGTGALTYQGQFTAQGGIQNTPIGNGTPSTAQFTTINSSGLSTLNSFYANTNSTVAGNLTVVGNLVVSGNVITTGSNNTYFTDSIIELHTLPNLANLTFNDGKDIGIRFHYYKTDNQNAFLGWQNETGYLEWLGANVDEAANANVMTGTYGTFKTGELILANSTISTSTGSGALIVAGGAGVAGNIYAGNYFYANGTQAVGPRGPQGPQGPQGPIGNTGPQGPQGPIGNTGPQGPQGPIGNTGPQGPQGPFGNTGPQGPQGPIGPIGNTGSQGPQGPQGPIGPIGPIGNTGPQGPQGPIGPIGNTGPQGPQGPIGPIGNTGPQGPQGPQGPIGPIGNTGPQGPQGPIGPIGNTGPQGPQGPIGPIGNTGSQGPQGPIGPIGNTGPQGPQGPIGNTGPQGPIGPIGNTGPQGPTGPSTAINATNTTTSQTTYIVGVTAAGSNQTPFVSATNAVYFNPNTGTLYAVAKSFRIPHPTKDGKMLVYGSLEGPENGIYARGRLTNNTVIELPDYWMQLADMTTITVNLTPIGRHQKLYVKNIVDNKIYVGNENIFGTNTDFYFMVLGERKDIAKLQVEE
jgi:hypothetical protein